MKRYSFVVVFEPQEEGGFTAIVPTLPGCISEGDTYEETKRNIEEAIKSYIESLMTEGETVQSVHQGQSEVISRIEIPFDFRKTRSRHHIVYA